MNPDTPDRRKWLIRAGVSALAGGALWQLRPGTAPSDASLKPGRLLPKSFWQTALSLPDGQTETLAAYRGQTLLLNFWASWCPPCVRELPELDRWNAEMAPSGARVLGLAVDQPAAVTAFLQRQPVGFTTLMAGTAGLALSRQLGNDAGVLPFSVLISRTSELLVVKAGALNDTDLARWAAWARR